MRNPSQCRGNHADRLYELFINRLRHPYAPYPMLALSMVNPYEKNQGSSSRRNAGGSDDLTFGSSVAQEQPIGDDMNTLILARQNAQAGKKRNATVQRRLQKAQTLGAVAGLVGGILAALFGSLITGAGGFG